MTCRTRSSSYQFSNVAVKLSLYTHLRPRHLRTSARAKVSPARPPATHIPVRYPALHIRNNRHRATRLRFKILSARYVAVRMQVPLDADVQMADLEVGRGCPLPPLSLVSTC